MKKVLMILVAACMTVAAVAQEFNPIPRAWKWIGDQEVLFTYDGTYTDEAAFSLNARTGARRSGVSAPAKFSEFPVKTAGAVNMTYSPDSTKIAFTRDNDLYVVDITSGVETRLTFDGSDVILNGYASWVYYEEILGRPSKYKAFWWSPDSRKIGFYRFDNSEVPMFPIYSAFANPAAAASQSQSPRVTDFGLGGSLSETRYPKCGQTNPQVRIGIVDLGACKGCPLSSSADCSGPEIVWAEFDTTLDQYFGIPFWGPDSEEFFIAHMPRIQNTIDLYAVNYSDGSKRHVYNETYKTWLNWFDGVVFTENGLYMKREFETGWQQIYFLSYDGSEFRRLTDGPNWNVSIVRVDEKKGDVYFTAKRDAVAKQALYKVDKKGVIKALTDPSYNATGISFSPDGKYFVASLSNSKTPTMIQVFPTVSKKSYSSILAADMKGPDYDADKYALGELVSMTTSDGFTLPGMIVYPKNFDPSKKYPVHVDIYGGPDSPLVVDRWITPNSANQWWSENGIIQITVDNRAGGHNGREGLDMIYRQLTYWEVLDFCEWADWLMEKPYVIDDKIGVEGFSYGGTMTCKLLMMHPDKFHYGIAGGGVNKWDLYDTHYTERYMETPQLNEEGYWISSVLPHVDGYPTEYCTTAEECGVEPVMLKLTHGTSDDNVHYQNMLLLIDEMHKHGKKFEFMVYPDGMHGYRGYQGTHFQAANHEFWLKYLLER